MDFTTHYKSPIGDITLASDGDFLIGLWFDEQKYFGEILAVPRSELAQRTAEPHLASALASACPAPARQRDLPVFAEARRWLDIYFSGQKPAFTPPLLMRATPFRKDVWEILLTIPYGKTATYGEIATALAQKRGVPRMSAQAVGNAVGHNAISLIIPCHRVIGANGNLTGYAAGLARKAWLLDLEKRL